MNYIFRLLCIIIFYSILLEFEVRSELFSFFSSNYDPVEKAKERKIVEIVLPKPNFDIAINANLFHVMQSRRTVRSFSNYKMNIKELSVLLWCAQGITNSNGFRTAPSAGGLFPIEVVVAVSNVEGLEKGLYLYIPHEHKLVMYSKKSVNQALVSLTFGQTWAAAGSVQIFITAIVERTSKKYKDRSFRYVCLEAGHVAQNIQLGAVALGLATSLIGAFNDKLLLEWLELDLQFTPLYIIPVGKPAN